LIGDRGSERIDEVEEIYPLMGILIQGSGISVTTGSQVGEVRQQSLIRIGVNGTFLVVYLIRIVSNKMNIDMNKKKNSLIYRV
jgi:hypothetical protein